MVVNPMVQTFQTIPPLEDPKYAQEFKIGRLLVEELLGRKKHSCYYVSLESQVYEYKSQSIPML